MNIATTDTNLLIDFLTILTSVYAIGFLIGMIVIGVLFFGLSDYQKRFATITISPIGLMGFIASIAFLGARLLN